MNNVAFTMKKAGPEQPINCGDIVIIRGLQCMIVQLDYKVHRAIDLRTGRIDHAIANYYNYSVSKAQSMFSASNYFVYIGPCDIQLTKLESEEEWRTK